jgi:hypothetical protein
LLLIIVMPSAVIAEVDLSSPAARQYSRAPGCVIACLRNCCASALSRSHEIRRPDQDTYIVRMPIDLLNPRLAGQVVSFRIRQRVARWIDGDDRHHHQRDVRMTLERDLHELRIR